MKRLFILITILKLFFLSTLAAGNPEGNKPGPIVEKAASNVNIIHLTNEEFKKLVFNYEKNKDWKYEGSKPAIIDFYADWCAPCRQLSPIVEEIAKQYSGKIIVYKVDTEKEKKLAQSLGITGLPTLLFIPMTGKPQVTMGALPKEALIKAVNEVLMVK